jgi:carboxyl-terminal processing protease
MQQFYRPLGASTQLEGVKSDVELPSITTHLPVGESDLDHAIAFDKVSPATFQASGRVTDDMLRALRERSAARVGRSEDFLKVQKDIAQYEKRKQEKTISLVEAEFERQWNEGKAADDEEKKLEEEMDAQRRPVVKRDFYFNEAMNVTADYLNSLAGGAAGLARSTIRAVEPPRPQQTPPVPQLQ